MTYQHYLQLCALALISTVYSHSWVERLNVIATNGTLMDPPGYPRGNVLRSSPTFGDPKMVFLIPPNGGPPEIQASQLMCKDTQVNQQQTDGSPRLKAAPGASVALRYQENGHVTLPANQPGKPLNRGTNFVYFTTQSKPDDKFLDIHRVWNVEGNGGDGRGRLISTQNFDDGQCYQINNDAISQTRQKDFIHPADQLQGADLWCQQDVQIPADARPGSTITLYWVWDWPTMPGTVGFPNGKQEIYTTCMDIDIVAGKKVSNKVVSQGFVQQNIGNAAISAQFADIANPTAVASPQYIPFKNVVASNSGTHSSTAILTSSTRAASASTSQSPCPHSNRFTNGGEKVTVTVTETITERPKVAATAGPRIVTVTLDDQITETVTKTSSQKTRLVSPKAISQVASGFAKFRIFATMVTSTAAKPSSSSTHLPCSETASATGHRLRGRFANIFNS